MTTLETFAKSFKKKMAEKSKELSKAVYECNELESALTTKGYERVNFGKERDQCEWECKMYVHHNCEIEKTNSKLKNDLEKLIAHLEGLRKSNGNLNNCIEEYSETGVAAAKKILSLSNKWFITLSTLINTSTYINVYLHQHNIINQEEFEEELDWSLLIQRIYTKWRGSLESFLMLFIIVPKYWGMST